VQIESHSEGTIYESGLLKGRNRGAWRVTIVAIGKGDLRAAKETERAIHHIRPHVAIFLGAAGGLKDVALGDVVAGTKILSYEFEKAADKFFPLPEVGNCSHALARIARSVAGDSRWRERLSKGRDGTPRTPKAYVGPIIAGEKVTPDNASDLWEFVRSQYSDAFAIEMEGTGFVTAVFANPSTSSLILRGISGRLDGKHGTDAEGWQQIAAEHAAAFACEVLAAIPTRRIRYRVTTEAIDEDELPQLLKSVREAAKDPTIGLETTKSHSLTLYIEGTRKGYDRLSRLFKRRRLPFKLGLEVYELELERKVPKARFLQGESRNIVPRHRQKSVHDQPHHTLDFKQRIPEFLAQLGFEGVGNGFELPLMAAKFPFHRERVLIPFERKSFSPERIGQQLGLTPEELVDAVNGDLARSTLYMCMATSRISQSHKEFTQSRRDLRRRRLLPDVVILLHMVDEAPHKEIGELDRRIIETRIPTLKELIDEKSEFSELAEMAMRAAEKLLVKVSQADPQS
jgi:nucleoside phosphorylase